MKRLGVFRNESLGFVDDVDEVDNASVTVCTSQAAGAPGANAFALRLSGKCSRTSGMLPLT